MKQNYIYIKLKDKSKIDLNKILDLFKLSFGNYITNLNYNKKKKGFLEQNLEISYYKNFIKKNIGKMIYKDIENKKIKIFNEKFISNNMKRVKIIANNKQYEIKGIVENQRQSFKIEIKFLDNIIKLNSMFKDCKSLSKVYNFENFNTKFLSSIFNLFEGCNSLIYIDDISNWNINNINNISKLFYQCSSLEILPDISRWNTTNIKYMFSLFGECNSLKKIPDISKWNLIILSIFLECLINAIH